VLSVCAQPIEQCIKREKEAEGKISLYNFIKENGLIAVIGVNLGCSVISRVEYHLASKESTILTFAPLKFFLWQQQHLIYVPD